MPRPAFLLIAPLLLASCQSQPPPAAPASSVPQVSLRSPAALASEGRAFAEARCSACHAVAARGISPNPDSPPFEAIANTPGLTAETLRAWLGNAHDFPAEMYFAIEPADIDDLVAYIVTLERADYIPPIE